MRLRNFDSDERSKEAENSAKSIQCYGRSIQLLKLTLTLTSSDMNIRSDVVF